MHSLKTVGSNGKGQCAILKAACLVGCLEVGGKGCLHLMDKRTNKMENHVTDLRQGKWLKWESVIERDLMENGLIRKKSN